MDVPRSQNKTIASSSSSCTMATSIDEHTTIANPITTKLMANSVELVDHSPSSASARSDRRRFLFTVKAIDALGIGG